MNYNELVNATWDMSVGIEYAMISMGKSTPIREQKVADAIGLGLNRGGDSMIYLGKDIGYVKCAWCEAEATAIGMPAVNHVKFFEHRMKYGR